MCCRINVVGAETTSANLVQLHFWFCTGCIWTSAPPAAPGLWCHLHWCRVEAWWCTGVRRCVAEYTGEQPAPSAASKAGAARGEGPPSNPRPQKSSPWRPSTSSPSSIPTRTSPSQLISQRLVSFNLKNLNITIPSHGEIARMLDGRMQRCLGTLEVDWQPWRRSSGITFLQAQEQTPAPAWWAPALCQGWGPRAAWAAWPRRAPPAPCPACLPLHLVLTPAAQLHPSNPGQDPLKSSSKR